MLEEIIHQQLEVQKGKLPMIKNDIVHLQNTLKILMGRNPSKIVTSRTLNEINTKYKSASKYAFSSFRESTRY